VSYLYRLAFPIEDDSLRMSQVINQAILIFPDEAAHRGVMVTGDVSARIEGEYVICEADAEVIPGRRVKLADRHGALVAELNAEGLNDRRVGIRLGLSTSAIQAIRTELRIPKAVTDL
jgi:hypothetical protein